jgi:hypothetical protein
MLPVQYELRVLWRDARGTDVWIENAGGLVVPGSLNHDATRTFPWSKKMAGHAHETISIWLQRVASHAGSLSTVLASDLSRVGTDKFWFFVQKKSARSMPSKENGGDA